MLQADFQTVDAYLAAQPEAAQAVLQRVRAIIRRAIPKAEELISYKISAYKLRGEPVIYFAGWKNYCSLYPVNRAVAAAFKEELSGYHLSGKGTVRFPLSAPVPAKLIGGIVRKGEICRSAASGVRCFIAGWPKSRPESYGTRR